MCGRRVLSYLYICALVFAACSRTEIQPTHEITPGNWFTILTTSDVEVVRANFPRFQPESFAPGVSPSSSILDSSNFVPARFFGTSQPQGFVQTPGGVRIETNGFGRLEQPFLPERVDYFDRNRTQYLVRLARRDLKPSQEIRRRLGLPTSGDFPPLWTDPTDTRIQLDEVDLIMSRVKEAAAEFLPAVSNLPPNTCEIVVEPTIFYVRNSNHGDTWAGGLVNPLGDGRYRLHVSVFYINNERIFADWRPFLAHEALNCYVMAVGRRDLTI